jgi:ABC-2 type transport system permease protein
MNNNDDNKDNNNQPIDGSAAGNENPLDENNVSYENPLDESENSFNENENPLEENSEGNAETGTEETGNPEPKKKVAFYKKRSFKFGSMATAFTAIFVVIVILLNIGLSMLSQKYPISVDLTKSKDYNISSDSIKYLSKISKPVTIKCFATQADMESQEYLIAPIRIIQQYAKYNSNIKIEYVDYDKNPTAVAQYADESVGQYDIVVSTTGTDGKERYKHIAASDLLIAETDSDTGSQSVVGNQAEQQIDTALDYVTSSVLPTVLFTQGHNEDTTNNGLQDLLKGENYTVSTVNTTSTAIDEKASAIAIVDPTSDFSSDEIDKIDKFLKNDGKFGKNIFVFLDPSTKPLPNLEDYMTEWGVKVESGYIYDSTNSFSNDTFQPIATTVDPDIVGSKATSNIGTDVAVARPLTVLFDSKDSRTVTKVIETGDTSRITLDSKGKMSSSDKAGPFTAMTLSTWTSDSDSSIKSNMIVSGSYQIANAQLLSESNKNNSKVLLGIADTLMNKESSITIASKYNETTTLSLTTGQRYIIMIVLVILVFAILIGGIVVWLRRRHL